MIVLVNKFGCVWYRFKERVFFKYFFKRRYFLLVLEIGIYVVVKLDRLLMDGV